MQNIYSLFERYINGQCTEAEFIELMDLLHKRDNEPEIRNMLKKVFEKTAQNITSGTYVNADGELQAIQKTNVEAAKPISKIFRKLVPAASILGLVLMSWWLLSNRLQVNESSDLLISQTRTITKKAEQKYIQLPDGSQVWLNAASELDFPKTFGSKAREVILKGEAFFDVKHVEGSAFIIHSGEVTTKVLGTAFNIKAYPGQSSVVVTVQRGKVQVSNKNKLVATLIVGQQVKVMLQPAPANETVVNENDVAAWKTGKLHFDKQPFSEIIDDLKRTYNVQITLDNKMVENELITASFKKEDGIQQALETLCELTNTQLTVQYQTYIIK